MRKVSKPKLILLFFCIVSSVYIFTHKYILFKLKGEYNFISDSDKDDVFYNYLFVKKHISANDLDKLIKTILYENNSNYVAKEMLIHELNYTNDRKYLKQLLALQKYADTLSDTTIFGNPHSRSTRFFTEIDEAIVHLSEQ